MATKRKTIFWHNTGPLMFVVGNTLHIEDLNPQMETKWVLKRAEMFWMGLRLMLASARASRDPLGFT